MTGKNILLQNYKKVCCSIGLFYSMGPSKVVESAFLNPNALRKAKIVCNVGLSECNSVNGFNLLVHP